MKPTADIVLDDPAPRPFGSLKGSVRWRRGDHSGPLELRLFWMTRGRGTEEVTVVGQRALRGLAGESTFEFDLPGSPYSCSGRLVSIVWAVELVDDQGDGVALREFTLAPDGRERVLEAIDEPRSQSKVRIGFRRRS